MKRDFVDTLRRHIRSEAMGTLTFDTLKLSRKLESTGFTHEQAVGAAAALADAFDSGVVTEDKLDARLKELELRLTLRVGGMLVAGILVVAALVKLL